MQIRSRAVSGLLAGCAALAFAAAPASAAQEPGPQTATTDAGSTCTVEANATVGAGLLVKPVDYSGSINCTFADPSNVGISSGGLLLQNTLPLGLSFPNAQPNDPEAQETVLPDPAFGNEQGPGFKCDLEPGVDCGFSGRENVGLPGQSYTAIFGTGITPPEGEAFVSASEGCTLGDLGTVSCASEDSVTVR